MKMSHVFKNHTVICGWNKRGTALVASLQALSARPIVIVAPEIRQAVQDVGGKTDVFVVAGDCGSHRVLSGADVETAWSVIVLADYALGGSADARSVEVALAVEKIRVSVHTVVELMDLSNKPNFSWTKVDELVSDEGLAVKIFAQGLYHVLCRAASGAVEARFRETHMLEMLGQMINPHQPKSQLFREELEWERVKGLRFGDVLAQACVKGLLPLAAVGYRRHEIPARPGQAAWTSWKADVRANPGRDQTFVEIWPDWPGKDYSLGIVLLARDRAHAGCLSARVYAQTSFE